MAYFTLALFLLAVAALWAGVLVFFMARHLLAPRRMTEARAFVRMNRTSPADLGLAFVPMGFTVNDARSRGKIRLAAWWLPAGGAATRTAVVVHGYGDAKIGGIAWAPTWHALGWNVLAVDLRAHGESEGTQSSAGFYERDDLNQIIDALRAEKPVAARSVTLFGVSLGAACVSAVAAGRDDLAAVVLESPYADYRAAVRVHVRRSGFPLVSLTNLICRAAEWLAGADFEPVRPDVTMPAVAAPLLVIAGEADFLIDIPALAEAIGHRPADRISEFAVFPDVPHVMALAVDPAGYHQRLASFLDAALAAQVDRTL